MIPTPTALALVGSLFSLLAVGWLKSGGTKLAISALAALSLIGVLVKIFRTTDFSSRRLLNGTPQQLAWIRIVVCLTALTLTVIEDLPAISSLPVGMQNDYQFFHFLNAVPGYAALLSNPYLLGALQWTTAILLFLGLLGFNTRMTLLLGSLGYILMEAILREYTYYFHSGIVPLYLLLVLPWTPCAAAWSIDRRLNPDKPKASPQSIGFSVYACFIVMAIVYLLCGLSKLRESGLDWFRPENIQHKLLQDAMNPIFLDYKWKATLWLVQHHAADVVYSAIGVVGVAVELGYFTVLFSRTAQIVLPAMAFGVHLGILVFQHILFLDLLMLQFIFLDVDSVANFLRQRFRFRINRKTTHVPPRNGERQMAPPSIVLAALAAVIATFLLAWVWRVEYYPLTAWHMYSGPEGTTPIFYYKVVANLENGSSIVVPSRNYCPAVMPNTRFLLMKAFRTTRRSQIFDQFLSAYVERLNRNLAFGSPISSIEVQRWRWNYAVDPNDPRFGWLTDQYVYDAAAKMAPLR